jgi:hypothetical protein
MTGWGSTLDGLAVLLPRFTPVLEFICNSEIYAFYSETEFPARPSLSGFDRYMYLTTGEPNMFLRFSYTAGSQTRDAPMSASYAIQYVQLSHPNMQTFSCW